VLRRLGIKPAGAGRDLAQAKAPAILEIPGEGRLLVFSFACETSGAPRRWAAGEARAGINFLSSLSNAAVGVIADEVAEIRRPRDVVVVSIHWGPNWGYRIPNDQRRFAHALIEEAGVSVVHGHSSHHAKAIEVYKGGPILYGCGDFMNDYKGIRGYEEFRDDLAVMYFADVDAAAGRLRALDMMPLKIRRLQLSRASGEAVDWLGGPLMAKARRLGRASRLRLASDWRSIEGAPILRALGQEPG